MEDLIIRILRGEATAGERQRVAEWREADPDHEREFAELEAVWRLTSADRLLGDSRPAPPIDSILGDGRRLTRADPRSLGGRWAPALAAAVAVVVVGAVFGPGLVDRLTGTTTVAAGPDGVRTELLADGSVLTLGPGGEVRVRFSAVARTVELDGEAFFVVAPDSARPFSVHAGDAVVRVLGTRFEVTEWEGRTRVVVRDGRVALSAGGLDLILTAGDAAAVSVAGTPERLTAPDPAGLTRWGEGLLVYHGSLLRTVAEEVAAAHPGRVLLLDSTLDDRRVVGDFRSLSFEETADAVCAIIAAQCETIDQDVRVRP